MEIIITYPSRLNKSGRCPNTKKPKDAEKITWQKSKIEILEAGA